MNKFFKSFFIVLLVVLTNFYGIIFNNKAFALDKVEIERSNELISKNCPLPGNENLISICGSVRQAMPDTKELSDGTYADDVTQMPVKGVSVYLYECDNLSPTCKWDGLLVHPFSSTTTNEYGRFHLVARKMDNNFEGTIHDPVDGEESTLNYTLQSKKRYLIFRCNGNFQGIHIIPSYLDLFDIMHEVDCPVEIEYSYRTPDDKLDFVVGPRLANHMGIEDPGDYYPPQDPELPPDEEGLHVAAQAYYEDYAKKTNQSIYITLSGADPRFTTPYHSAGKAEAMEEGLGGFATNWEDLVPTQGAWWSYDCYEKYKGTKWVNMCAGYTGGDGIEESQRDNYEEQLYKESRFTVQQLLPNIPPTYEVLFYRPLEVRHDLSGYYQDPDDIAKFLGYEFANCVGKVFKRQFGEDIENYNKLYPPCDLLKECNKTLSTFSHRNSYTTGGPSQGFGSPAQYTELKDTMQGDIPVCIIMNEDLDIENEIPVKLDEIQQPGESCKSYHRLCEDGSYWNNYYLTNLGGKNLALKWGASFENSEDSYSRSGNDCSGVAFQAGGEGDDVPMAGCQSATVSSGDRAANNSIGAAAEITTPEGESQTEILTDWIAQPFEDESLEKEIISGIGYYISSQPMAWGQFSKTNAAEEYIITSPSDDDSILDNWFSDMENPYSAETIMNDNHYPGEDFNLLNLGGPTISGGIDGGTRTGTSGMYLTTPSWDRIKALQGKENVTLGPTLAEFTEYDLKVLDSFDSTLSISTGHSKIDWLMAEVKGGVSIFDAIVFIFEILFSSDRERNKTFTDRNPSGLVENQPGFIDDIAAEGFDVNEANFRTLFPLPCLDTGLQFFDWGDGEACYPWHEVPFEQLCMGTKTSQKETMCHKDGAAAGVETGTNTVPGVSRTCRVTECHNANVTATCTCTRTMTNFWDVFSWHSTPDWEYYNKICPVDTGIEKDPPWFKPIDGTWSINISDGGDNCAPSTPDDGGNRLTCALNQKTCWIRPSTRPDERMADMRKCLKETYYDDPVYPAVDEFREEFKCANAEYPEWKVYDENGLLVYNDFVDGEPTITQEGSAITSVSTPMCLMSYAGPNECDGDIDRNVDIGVNSQVTDENSDLEKYNADGIPEAGLKFQKSFRDPSALNISPMPAAWVSVASSMSDVEPDQTQRKDWPGIGAGTAFLTRAQFGQPNSFGEETGLEPLYIHCRNEQLGTSGLWEDNTKCEFNTLPQPEILELEDLQAGTKSNGCALNPSEECARYIMGTKPTGEVMEFSDTFIAIMNYAGSNLDVEPAALLVYMEAIKSTRTYGYYWSVEGEEELKNVSLPWYGTFNFCDDLERPAQKPYDWILTYFIMNLRNTDAGTVLEQLSAGRSNTASRCNFLDATVVTSAALAPNIDDRGGCGGGGNSAWINIKPMIEMLMWGFDPKGAYSDDNRLDGEPYEGAGYTYEDIYDACR